MMPTPANRVSWETEKDLQPRPPCQRCWSGTAWRCRCQALQWQRTWLRPWRRRSWQRRRSERGPGRYGQTPPMASSPHSCTPAPGSTRRHTLDQELGCHLVVLLYSVFLPENARKHWKKRLCLPPTPSVITQMLKAHLRFGFIYNICRKTAPHGPWKVWIYF